jgi:hypothetical protein
MNNSHKFFFLLSPLLLFPFAGCKKDAAVEGYLGHQYFPLNTGHEIIYDVDSIVKNEFNLGQVDTFRFQIKEVVESYFTDNEGRETARLERYKRSDSSQPWVIHKVWTANLTLNTAEKKEDNITYIKLIFPPVKNRKWNGNARNEYEEQEYRITDTHRAETINNIPFDSVTTVLQADEDNIVYKKFEIEKYAANAGLVYKEQFNGQYGLSGSSYVLKSYIHYTERIVSYKN